MEESRDASKQSNTDVVEQYLPQGSYKSTMNLLPTYLRYLDRQTSSFLRDLPSTFTAVVVAVPASTMTIVESGLDRPLISI